MKKQEKSLKVSVMFSTHLILTGQQGFDVAIKALEQEPCTVDSKPIVQAHWIE